ncbi:ribonuclease R [Clostridium botulinum]|uniref:Ribonuclease R n=1 Tax=Clostridium botulinum TaxID=1491 RepID=A0A0C2NT60_CLOBO|nr:MULTISPECIES: ribonuclease R [Clostridium]ACD52128.1 ribonuclease R [Clostridium botulinum E3 str. Alaska E43]AJF30620.1 ribonuclease R [Clostridium botulinum]AJF33683.1 ribonuclease R [Clostridium botulinum]KAI3349359.1 ribonuclease R [Clostridium botulinum]KIL07859.1 ribonuclease R [Clostridium botulinum]
MTIKETLLSFMKEPAYSPMTIEELALVFDIKSHEYGDFKKMLKIMGNEGLISTTEKNKYFIAENASVIEERAGLITGRLQAHPKGFGFLIPDAEGESDVFIPGSCMNGAINGDKIQVEITRENSNTKKREGEVYKILERNTTKIVGIYEDNKNFGFVVSEDTRITQDIFISKKDRNGAENGDVVIVEITKWPDRKRSPEGLIKEVLGKKGDKGIDILTIIRKFGLPEEFSKKVLKFAEQIPETIKPEEYKRRVDLRNLRMVTIDGEDAKDLDDAVSIEKLDDGNFKLGVHIADVTHYVRENNILDKEALKRATSVYLIDRVIPMLPKQLSNGICSLNPKVDRLALSCFMVINNKGTVVDHEIMESVIKTSERMTYTDVTKILRDNDEELIKKYDYLCDDFKLMEELCLILRNKRMKRGAIDFDFEESKIILDEMGKPIDIKPYEREIANKIIEEFMLVCNETVAEHMFWSKLPFVYRVHETPDEEKLVKFKEFIYNLGYKINWSEDVNPKTLQSILEQVKGKKEETIVSTLLLRSMMQARYAPECVGHFGLAAQYYCHFTSPIRRYPDLQIHRIIKEHLNGEIDDARFKKLVPIVDVASKQSSEKERVAQEAEREVDDLKKAEYMLDKIGEEFDGMISSVTSFGMFVELPNTIEGLVHVTELDDDYYIFDEAHLALIGEKTKNMHKLGDEVKVKCVKVDIDNREIYFKLVSTKIDEDSEDKENNEEKTSKEIIKELLSSEEDPILN